MPSSTTTDDGANPWPSRVWNLLVSKPLLVLVALATLTGAAITVTYLTDTTVTTETADPPVQFRDGGDTSSTGDYVTSFSRSTNDTYLTATVKGVPEANLTVDSFFKLENVDDAEKSVTLSTSQVTNGNVDDYSIVVLDDTSNTVDVLELTESSPSASTSIPASTTYEGKLHLELASGTTDSDLNDGLDVKISLDVS